MPAFVTVKQEPGHAADDGSCLGRGATAASPAQCAVSSATLPDAGSSAASRALRSPVKVDAAVTTEAGADSGHSSPAQLSAAGSSDGCAATLGPLRGGGGRGDRQLVKVEAAGDEGVDYDDCLSSEFSLSDDEDDDEDDEEPIDDDFGELTSLAWLLNANLLRKGGGGEPRGQRGQTTGRVSAAGSGGGGRPAAPTGSACQIQRGSGGSSAIVSQQQQQHSLTSGAGGKPPYSFSCLIFMAIEESAGRRLPVKDIYGWIARNFPYYQSAPAGWKNSVRHNLSLNKCFKKIDRDEYRSSGKGSCWCVDPLYRPNLLQALRRSPYFPQHQLQIVSLAGSLSKLSKRLVDEASCGSEAATATATATCCPPRLDIEAANALVSLRMPPFKREGSPGSTAPVNEQRGPASPSSGAYDDAAVELGGRKRKHCSEPSAEVAAGKAPTVVTDVPSLDHTYVVSSAAADGHGADRLSLSDSSVADDNRGGFCHRDEVMLRGDSEEANPSDLEPAAAHCSPAAAASQPPPARQAARQRLERNRRVLQAYGRATLAVATRSSARNRRAKAEEAARSGSGGTPPRSLLSLASAASLAMMDAGLGRPAA